MQALYNIQHCCVSDAQHCTTGAKGEKGRAKGGEKERKRESKNYSTSMSTFVKRSQTCQTSVERV
jgi:hypothetical protein